MKAVEEITACVVDYGTFLCLAEKLGETYAKTYYHTPFAQEYQDVRDCIQGAGLDRVERLDDYMDPDTFNSIDLWIFPDIGFGGFQRYLRAQGKAVWGHFAANEIEVYRTLFLDTLKRAGLPMVHCEEVVGLSALAEYLKEHENVWVKVNRFRQNMETWHSKTYEQSIPNLDALAVIFGGAKEQIVFIVQANIKTAAECGYDGWSIDGYYPIESFQGYEKKNELYLGCALPYHRLPQEIRYVNDAMAPILKDYGYRDWWSTEIRVGEDKNPYFIDATPRMAGQTGEHQLETIQNFADIVWQGANGILIDPIFNWRFAAEATLHYKSDMKDPTVSDQWKQLQIPENVMRWVKLYHYCKIGDTFHFPGKNTDEVGVVLGVGDSAERAIEHLEENLAELKECPVSANIGGFASLLEEIQQNEAQGLHFGGRVPDPSIILKKGVEL